MKTTLVRLLALATLATSVSAFAASDDSKRDAAANTSATSQQNPCADNASHNKKQNKAKKTQDEDQKDKDYDRSLLGNYG